MWIQRRAPSGTDVEAGLREQAQWAAAHPAHIVALRDLFDGHDAFDALAAVLVAQAENHGRPVAQRDSFLDGTIAGELTAMLLVERAGRAPTGVPKMPLADTALAASPHLRALTHLAGAIMTRYWERVAHDPVAVMQERFVRRYLYVPFNETDAQVRALTRDLFDDRELEEWLTANVGFGPRDADQLVTAAHEALIERSANGPNAVDVGLGRVLALTPDELATRANTERAVASAFCARLSQPFGQPPRSWPALPTSVRHRPMLDDGKGAYIPASPAMLRRAARHTLAAALNPAIPVAGPGDEAMHQRYLARRGRLVEHRAVEALRPVLRPTHVFENLHFAVHGPGGREGEIDGLLIVAQTAVVLQAKSAPTRIDAVAGDPEGFRSVLEHIVGDAMRQHNDARSALQSERNTVTFWTHQGGRRTTVTVPDLTAAEILPITVTLDDLSGCAPASWELHDAGLVDSGPLPWIVGLTPLQTMTSLLHYAAQLVQFLRRRAELNISQNLDVSDEIDIFLEYLHDHLQVVYARPSEPAILMPPERFHALDVWLQAQRAGDRRVKPPRQKLHRGIRRLIERLERDQPPGWLDASVAALNPPEKHRRRLGALVERTLSKAATNSTWGLTYAEQGGRKVSFALVPEARGRLVDDDAMRREVLARARNSNATALYAFVVPEDPAGMARTLWSGDVTA